MVLPNTITGVPLTVVPLWDAFVIALNEVGGIYFISIFFVDFTLTYSAELVELPSADVVVPPKRIELSTKIGNLPFESSLKS